MLPARSLSALVARGSALGRSCTAASMIPSRGSVGVAETGSQWPAVAPAVHARRVREATLRRIRVVALQPAQAVLAQLGALIATGKGHPLLRRPGRRADAAGPTTPRSTSSAASSLGRSWSALCSCFPTLAMPLFGSVARGGRDGVRLS